MTFALSTEGFHAFIIGEAGPLMTIGLENEFSRLLRPPLPVVIPDVIYRDATGGQVVDGNPTAAMAVLDWVRGNDDVVRLAPTQAGMAHDLLYGPSVDRLSQADAAMIEAADSFLARSADQRAFLVLDDPGSFPNWTDSRLLFASVDDFLDISRGRQRGYVNTY